MLALVEAERTSMFCVSALYKTDRFRFYIHCLNIINIKTIRLVYVSQLNRTHCMALISAPHYRHTAFLHRLLCWLAEARQLAIVTHCFCIVCNTLPTEPF